MILIYEIKIALVIPIPQPRLLANVYDVGSHVHPLHRLNFEGRIGRFVSLFGYLLPHFDVRDVMTVFHTASGRFP